MKAETTIYVPKTVAVAFFLYCYANEHKHNGLRKKTKAKWKKLHEERLQNFRKEMWHVFNKEIVTAFEWRIGWNGGGLSWQKLYAFGEYYDEHAGDVVLKQHPVILTLEDAVIPEGLLNVRY